mgnify:CR=1 FL=1
MTTSFDLYGFKGATIHSARKYVEGILGVSLVEKESAYHGGVYYVLKTSESENLVLKENADPFDGGAVEQSFPDFLILLYVNGTNRSSELKVLLQSEEEAFLLRHEML